MVEILESEIELNSDKLAERLGVTPRTIGNYKKYELLSKKLLVDLYLKAEDLMLLEMISERLKFNNDIYSKE